MAHVPYKGGGEAIIDVIAGHMQAGCIDMLQASASLKARTPACSRGDDGTAFVGVAQGDDGGGVRSGRLRSDTAERYVALAGILNVIIARLNAEVDRILQKPLVRERLAADGATPGDVQAQHFGAFIREDIVKWSKVVRRAGLVRKDIVKWLLHAGK